MRTALCLSIAAVDSMCLVGEPPGGLKAGPKDSGGSVVLGLCRGSMFVLGITVPFTFEIQNENFHLWDIDLKVAFQPCKLLRSRSCLVFIFAFVFKSLYLSAQNCAWHTVGMQYF